MAHCGPIKAGLKWTQFAWIVVKRSVIVEMKLMGKEINLVLLFVGGAFLSLFLFFLSEGNPMPRDKKKMNYNDLEQHVTNWVLDQIEGLRNVIDEIEDTEHLPDNDKAIIFGEIAGQFHDLLQLMKKINHDERHIFNWVEDFIIHNRLIDTEN